MSLYYATGDGLARASFARHSLGADVILCAPGPSMESVARAPGILVAALTKAYPIIKPDIWFGLDGPECYDRGVWAEGFTKVTSAGNQDLDLDGRRLRSFPNTYFATLREGPVSNIFRCRGHDVDFLWRKDTLMMALHYLIWAGAGANGHVIYFNGFNLGHSEGRDYTPGIAKTLSPDLRKSNQRLFNGEIGLLAEFTRLANLNGIACMNTTLGSPLSQFMPYRPLRVAVDLAARDVPKPGPLLHSFETARGRKELAARAAVNKVLPFSPRGVKVALARSQIAKALKASVPRLKVVPFKPAPRIDLSAAFSNGALDSAPTCAPLLFGAELTESMKAADAAVQATARLGGDELRAIGERVESERKDLERTRASA